MTTVVDGTQIQAHRKRLLDKKIANHNLDLQLDILRSAGNRMTKVFTQLKQRFGRDIGVAVTVHELSETTSQKAAEARLSSVISSQDSDGVIVQLPLADRLDQNELLGQLPPDKDVDVLGPPARKRFRQGESPVLPPVVGAVAEICTHYEVSLQSKRIAVVGHGQLVGWPVAVWLQNSFGDPLILEKGDSLSRLQSADVVISGAGDPHAIKPKHIQRGVCLIDAGTSRTEGGTKGDMHPDCKDRARLFSPVPGGVGPITVARLFANLVTLSAS